MVDRDRRRARGALVRRLRRAVPRRVREAAHPHSHLERINWRESYQITMAGLAATRLFAAAGAGGIALTAWALRRSGMEPRLVACRMVAFIVILYTVYAGSLLIDGLGLGLGPVPGRRLVRDHVRAGDRRGGAVRRCAVGDRRCCRATSSGDSRAGPTAAGGCRASGSRARRRCRRSVASGVRTAMDVVRATRLGRARRAGLVGLRHLACCGRCSTPSARRRRSR